MRHERGSTFIFAMVLLLFASMLGAILLERSRAVAGATKEDRHVLRAFHAAEGGLDHARHALAKNPTYAGETLRIGECEVTVRVTGNDVVAMTPGCRIDATLDCTESLPRVVAFSAR